MLEGWIIALLRGQQNVIIEIIKCPGVAGGREGGDLAYFFSRLGLRDMSQTSAHG